MHAYIVSKHASIVLTDIFVSILNGGTFQLPFGNGAIVMSSCQACGQLSHWRMCCSAPGTCAALYCQTISISETLLDCYSRWCRYCISTPSTESLVGAQYKKPWTYRYLPVPTADTNRVDVEKIHSGLERFLGFLGDKTNVAALAWWISLYCVHWNFMLEWLLCITLQENQICGFLINTSRGNVETSFGLLGIHFCSVILWMLGGPFCRHM